VDVLADNVSWPITRLALAFSQNGYPIYNVDLSKVYVVDTNDVSPSTGQVWSPTTDDIPGITENDTYPSSVCNGATDGHCDTLQIFDYYASMGVPSSSYAAGLCYQKDTSHAWYLPSTCELNGGLYQNLPGTTQSSYKSCAPITTGIMSLYSLGLVPNVVTGSPINGGYWSATESSSQSTLNAWAQFFSVGEGGDSGFASKGLLFGVRCSQALPL
jgi:hypothetical protein